MEAELDIARHRRGEAGEVSTNTLSMPGNGRP
jgi:hypothetical protein